MKSFLATCLFCVSFSLFAEPSCEVLVFKITNNEHFQLESTDYYTKQISIPNSEVPEEPIVLDLVSDQDPTSKIGKARVWAGRIFTESGKQYVDISTDIELAERSVNLGLTLSLDATFVTATTQFMVQKEDHTENYHCNLTCANTI